MKGKEWREGVGGREVRQDKLRDRGRSQQARKGEETQGGQEGGRSCRPFTSVQQQQLQRRTQEEP